MIKARLIILIIVFVFSSCSSAKNVVENPEKETQVQQIPEPPKPPLPLKLIENTNETVITESIEVKNNADEIIGETDTMVSAEAMLKEVEVNEAKKTTTETQIIKEEISFNQKLVKKEGYIHSKFDELLQKYVSKNGNVDYKGFKKSHKDLLAYIKVLTLLYPKLDELSNEEKLTYWINAYNALTVDLILRNYPLKSIKDIKDPWDQRLWKFGDKWYNLNDIEHKILRKMDEPRIHFAIVCASVSCPKLQNEAFKASNLEAQLTHATKEFLADTTKNKISENSIQLSKIFKWFKKDFEQNGSLIDFLNQYSEAKISPKAKKSFMDYNWDLND